MIYTPYIWPLLIAAALLGGIALYIRRFRHVLAVQPFSILMTLAMVWAILLALEISTREITLKNFWLNLRFPAIAFMTPFLMILTLEYTGKSTWFSWKSQTILLIEPTIIALLALSNNYHNLFQYNFRLDLSGPFPVMLWDRGPFFWLHLVYVAIIYLCIFGLLIAAFRTRTLRPGDTALIMLGILIPRITDTLFNQGITPIRGYNLTPIMFVITGWLYLWALLRFRFFDIAPVARNTVMDHMSDIVIVLDPQNHIVDFNPAAQVASGVSPKKLIGTRPSSLPPEWASLFQQYHGIYAQNAEVTIGFGDKSSTYDLTISPIRDHRKRNLGRLFLFHDVTERILAERARRDSEKRYQQLFELLPEGIIIHSQGQIIFANPTSAAIIGAEASDGLVGKQVLDFVHPDSRNAVIERLQKIATGKETAPLLEEKFVRFDGQVIDAEVTSRPLEFGGMEVTLTAFHDITARKQADEKLRQLSRAVEQSPATIVITDMEGIIEYANPSFSRITGYTLEEALGQNPRILKSGYTPPETYVQLWQTLIGGKEWRGEFINRKKNGDLYYESASISPIIDANGLVTHYVAVKEDITERKQVEERTRQANEKLQAQLVKIQALQAELREQAIRDSLTGLYNRRFLNETLERELARAIRENYSVSFVMMDIDYFKMINDTFGHLAGDLVIQNLTTQLKGHTRAGDIACRYGGEEFLMVLPNTTTEDTYQAAERWREAFQESNVKFFETEIKATLSLGIATFPDHGASSREVLAAADKAMYKAKAAGRNCVVVC
jgi:diguanylate cyclase (GGDEF)-like protein/PAS domain S-box-containing protein